MSQFERSKTNWSRCKKSNYISGLSGSGGQHEGVYVRSLTSQSVWSNIKQNNKTKEFFKTSVFFYFNFPMFLSDTTNKRQEGYTHEKIEKKHSFHKRK